MKRIKLVIIGLAMVLLSAWTARAAPQLNPPPVIWCPGPGGVMALCSPLPTPTWSAPGSRRMNGYFFTWRQP